MDEEGSDVMNNIVENVNEVEKNNAHGVNDIVIDNIDEEGNDVMDNISENIDEVDENVVVQGNINYQELENLSVADALAFFSS